jgi:hypothetical protein
MDRGDWDQERPEAASFRSTLNCSVMAQTHVQERANVLPARRKGKRYHVTFYYGGGVGCRVNISLSEQEIFMVESKAVGRQIFVMRRQPHRSPINRLYRGLGAALSLFAILFYAGCATPTTDVIDLSLAPAATQDAMLRVQILPLGMNAPSNVGSVGPIAGYGCGDTPTDAATNAVQQLQVKALQRQATAVMSVVLAQATPSGCAGAYAANATGIAVAQRGIPPVW